MNTKGGNACIYLSNNILRFDDNSKLKASEAFGFDGALVDVGLVKSRTNKAGQVTTLVFNQERGFDPDLSLFILLKQAGRLNGAGVGMYLRDRNDMKFSQKNFKERLEANPELKQVFMEEVIDELKNMLTADTEITTAPSGLANSILDNINSDLLSVA